MNAKHTPGPWKADGYNIRQSGLMGTRHVAEIAYTGPHHTPPNEYPSSCRLQDEANARLIAAAPDLLHALQMMLGCELIGGDQRDGLPDEPGTSPVSLARAAIDKATKS